MQKLLNTREAAAILGLRPNTLEIWRCKRKGPKYKKIGRRVLYSPADLEEYSASCTITNEIREMKNIVSQSCGGNMYAK